MSELVAYQPVEVPVAGGSLATYLVGRQPAGPPGVVAVHGITSNSRAWTAVAGALTGDAGMLAVDLRGRGRSSHLPPPYGIDAHVGDVLATLDRIGTARAVIVGHSLGAYVAARMAAEHPDRVRSLVLVDGGLAIGGVERLASETSIEEFLGPALARLRLRFPSRLAYRRWWRGHPALAGDEVEEDVLAAYADHDLVGEEPELRVSISEEAVRADATGLAEAVAATHRLTVPAVLLCAPRGLLGEPKPMQPLPAVQAWAGEAPELRRAERVEGVNHYTITLGRRGAAAVAAELAGAAAVS